MVKKLVFVLIILLLGVVLISCTGQSTGNTNDVQITKSETSSGNQTINVIDTKENKADIEYGLIIDDIKFMKFIMKNNTGKDFEFVWPTTHTFDFRLYKDDKVIWDFYKDYGSHDELNWETHITFLAGREFEQQIWFGNMPKDLNGTYTYEFYYIGGQLKDVPHLTGTLELVSGQDGVCRSKKLKIHMN